MAEKSWHKYRNAFDVLYPSKQKWIIGGQAFYQTELGWVEVFNAIGKVKLYYDLMRLYGNIDNIYHELALQMDYKTLKIVFLELMDRQQYAYRYKAFGGNLFFRASRIFGKQLPPIFYNASLYALILKTDKVEFLSKYLDNGIALGIQSLFLQQNDLKSFINSFSKASNSNDDKPSLGFYEQYIELLRIGIEIPDTWSIRKIDMIYDVLIRKNKFDELEQDKKIGIRDRIKAGEENHKISKFQWVMDNYKQAALFGIEKSDKDKSKEIATGDY